MKSSTPAKWFRDFPAFVHQLAAATHDPSRTDREQRAYLPQPSSFTPLPFVRRSVRYRGAVAPRVAAALLGVSS